jgi:hypothetical protein
MRLPNVFALGTCWCLTALWGCAEGTLHREDDAPTKDNPFPRQLTFTRGSIAVDGELPPSLHTLRVREPSSALDAGTSHDPDAATPVDAAALPDATADAAPSGDAGN